jgi:predicted AlkP superfamily phosphohydrolase/phosphomutase
LRSAVPNYTIDLGWTAYSDYQIPQFLSDLNDLTRKTYQLAKFCLNKENWDFFMVVFVGPDRLQHRLWNLIATDINSPTSTPTNDDQMSKVREYFELLDTYIADLLNDSGEESTVFVLSDHGFGPFLKDFDLNNWLAKEGFLNYTSGSRTNRNKPSQYLKRIARGLGVSRKSLVSKFGNRIDVYKYLEKVRSHNVNIDWQRTKAFCFSSHFIYINLKGRERNGIVNPDKEYHNVIDDIIDKLYSLKDPETGNYVVEEAKPTAEVYHGIHLQNAPDIIITKYHNAGYIGLERIFRKQSDNDIFVKTARYQTGVHRLDGFFICRGNNIMQNKRVDDANIVDLLPTILSVNDCHIPDDIDGKILTSVFKMIDEKSPRFKNVVREYNTTDTISERDKSKIRQRLKDLGYM